MLIREHGPYDKKWKHDNLADDLAKHLQNGNRLIWTDMQLGPAGSSRPDVYTIEKSYTRPSPKTFECKVSREDFRSDITSGKWQKYLQYSSSVVFAVPKGLVKRNEIPKGCGLITRSEKGWRYLKSPTIQKVTIPEKVWLKLLMDGINRIESNLRIRDITSWKYQEKIRKKFGERIAKAVWDYELFERQVETLKQKAVTIKEKIDSFENTAREEIRSQELMKLRYKENDIIRRENVLNTQKKAMCEALKIDPSKEYEMDHILNKFIESLKIDAEVEKMLIQIRKAQQQLTEIERIGTSVLYDNQSH